MAGTKSKSLKGRKERQVVKYRDTDGHEWEALEGEPSGCFTLPGQNGQLYSIRSFMNFVAKSVAKVKITNSPESIETAGNVDFADAMLLTGEPLPPKGRDQKSGRSTAKAARSTTGSTKTVTVSEEESPLVANYLTVKKMLSLKRNCSGLTKAMLVKQTSLSVHQIARAMGYDKDAFKTERRGRDTFYTLA